jgi:peptide/nickel transport system ATP-binding protein
MVEPLLAVSDLRVEFTTRGRPLAAVRGLDYAVDRGETLGLVGESGSGKSVSALALLGLLPKRTGRVTAGRVMFEGEDLLRLSEARMRRLRGGRIAMIFQDPLSSLNPLHTIGHQIAEALEVHLSIGRREADRRAIGLLELVGIPEAGRRARQFPHEFSGGMRQRAMIAMALSCEPSLLIADEPTTALDVTIQAQIIDLLRRLRADRGMSIVMITHDLALLAGFADRIAVMYAGRIVEAGTVDDVLLRPTHPYTLGLLGSLPRLDEPRQDALIPIPGSPPNLAEAIIGCPFEPRCPRRLDVCQASDPSLEPVDLVAQALVSLSQRVACHNPQPRPRRGRDQRPLGAQDAPPVRLPDDRGTPTAPSGWSNRRGTPLLQVTDLKVSFPVKGSGILRRQRAEVKAVDGVTFHLEAGETLGLVGESGSGKTTIGRSIVRLSEAMEGSIVLSGEELLTLTGESLRARRRRFQLVFQDPYSSLDPRHTIGETLAEPLRVHGLCAAADIPARVAELLRLVGLDPSYASRYPHEFSGGQRQRVGIARAIAVEPDVIICDEPISALDVSIQAQVVNLLVTLQREMGLTYLFIAHDLALVRHIADRIVVLYLGKIVETASSDTLYSGPLHPYTIALLSAVPIPDPVIERGRQRLILKGEIPSPLSPPSGCRFHTRCWMREAMGNPEVCATDDPALESQGSLGQSVACHFAGRVDDLIPSGAVVGRAKRESQSLTGR